MQVSLNQSAQVTLDISGNGVARLGPLTAREVWSPQNVHVSTNQTAAAITNEAECQIFVGSDTSQTGFRDATFNGSHGDSTDKVSADTIKCGTYILAKWIGGDSGATGILTVTGTNDV